MLRWSRLSGLSRRLSGGTALGVLALSLMGVQGLAAQELPLRPTSAADDLDTPLDPGGLRGSEDAPVGPVDPQDSTAQPAEPTGPQGPDDTAAPPRRLFAGQGSALLTPRVGAPQLPALAPYPSSARPRGAAIDTIDPTTSIATPVDPAVVSPTVAALPVPTGLARRRIVDDKPFAPLGITVGSLRFTPYFEESLGYDSNPEQASSGKGSGFSRSEGGFSLLSLWSSNELRSEMHAGYDAFFSDPSADRPDAAGTIDYRYDVTRDLKLDVDGRFAVTTQRAGSPELSASVQGRPLVSSYGTTIGGSDTFGKLTLGLHGLFDRTEYENGRLGDGTTVALADQNFNDYGLTMRADYALLPTLKPFAEVTLDTRVHDQRLDMSGYARDSDGALGRVGTTFELTPLITGSVDVGYENRTYADKRLRDLRGPLVDASIAYAITPLTTLTLLASTTFDETNLAGSPGAESRSVSLTASHALLRNLTLSASLGYLNTDYVASTIHEDTYSATLKASYAISRTMVLEASYNHETLRSTEAGSSFDQDVFLLGLRVQR